MGTRSNLKFESPPNPRGILALNLKFRENIVQKVERHEKLYIYLYLII